MGEASSDNQMYLHKVHYSSKLIVASNLGL